MLISIIIPTFNRAHLIGETLDSILAQTYQNWECIVVDDGSTDNTDEVIEAYIKSDNRFKFFRRPSNRIKGPSACRNIGFDESLGEFINFFDSDDILKPDTFKVWLAGFKDEIDSVVSKIEFVNMDDSIVIKQNKIKSDNLVLDHFLGNICFYVCGPLWRRSFLEGQSYLFDETLRNGDDWDFNMRMLYQTPQLILLNDSYIQNRIHGASLSLERKKLNKQELISYFKAFNYHLKLLKEINFKHYKKCEIYVIRKYSIYLRNALKNKSSVKYWLLKNLVSKELEGFYFRYFIKTLLGFISYSLTGKGYRFFNV